MSPFTKNEEKAAIYRRLAETPEIRWDNGTLTTDGTSMKVTIDPTTGRISAAEDPAILNSYGKASVTISYDWVAQRPS